MPSGEMYAASQIEPLQRDENVPVGGGKKDLRIRITDRPVRDQAFGSWAAPVGRSRARRRRACRFGRLQTGTIRWAAIPDFQSARRSLII